MLCIGMAIAEKVLRNQILPRPMAHGPRRKEAEMDYRLFDSSTFQSLLETTIMLLLTPFISSALEGSLNWWSIRKEKKFRARRRQIEQKMKRYWEIDIRKTR